ncbi:MAG: ATP-binding protein [Bacteroidota bacterium]|nr:ATP-binding protein [Bacteroidota bacterium]MDE2645217.1 ATP-binding protein [Bacteroidota bacterium]MXW13491.1 ATP-binding protein [Rhodothermaceae bacterium]MYC04187.1 ATP-binding protein [Rhodothermaceae bacterium]MYI16360.1 ATP-binding protein [Rhodothermaceae bacterium]
MPKQEIIPRQLRFLLSESIRDTPVTLIHGPRQSGKTTFARSMGESLDYSYSTFDDAETRVFAQNDPMGFISDCADQTILDEVQRVPELFRTLKLSVDRNRKPGRFILTGSTSLLLVPELADALVGRMEVLRLHPLSQQEIEQTQSPHFLDRLFAGDFRMRQKKRLAKNLVDRVVSGGYPEALGRPVGRRRTIWFQNYVNNIIQKDVLDLAKIRSLEAIPNLLTYAANLSGQLFNVSTLASKLQMSYNTVRDYAILLEHQFLIERLSPWYGNRMKRLIKTPKIHFGDTGLACALLGVDTNALLKNRGLLGQLVETFVFQELKRQASSSHEPYIFHHFRDRDGVEVDMVIERGAFEIAGIEVKAAASISNSDFRGLRKIKAAYPDKFTFGAVLYDGEMCGSFGDGMYVVPIRMLWESD